MPVDRAAELTLDERAHDLRAEAAADLTFGKTRAAIAHRNAQARLRALRLDLYGSLATREPVLDGICLLYTSDAADE